MQFLPHTSNIRVVRGVQAEKPNSRRLKPRSSAYPTLRSSHTRVSYQWYDSLRFCVDASTFFAGSEDIFDRWKLSLVFLLFCVELFFYAFYHFFRIKICELAIWLWPATDYAIY